MIPLGINRLIKKTNYIQKQTKCQIIINTAEHNTMRRNLMILPLILMLFMPFFTNGYQTRQEIVQALFRCVEKWMGTKYVLGGETKTGIDCSAFVMVVYKEVFNMEIPRRVRDQAKLGTLVKDRLQPGTG